MTRTRKPSLLLFVSFALIISLFMGRTYAIGGMESYGTCLEDSYQVRPAKRCSTLRDQPANQKPGNPLALGSWGGQHINLEVTADGALVEYDCARGTISRRIILDRRGRFSVPGTYIQEHGGPVRQGEQPNSVPVQFIGRVSGKRMYLTVKRRDTGKLIGSFTLVSGQEASVVKCR